MEKNKIAVVLAGCGAKDGSEITESAALLIALSAQGYDYDVYAPNRNNHHTVDHLNGAESEPRNMLHEAARIARGKIKPLAELRESDYAALTFAGGFGVAKNLCDFAFKGADAKLSADTADMLYPFIKKGKPVGTLCISPIILAIAGRELGLKNVHITLGDGSSEAVAAVKSWGIVHEPKGKREACIDLVNRFVSAPAYMYDDANPADIYGSAVALITGLTKLLSEKK